MTIDVETEVLTTDQTHPTSPHHRANGKFAPGNVLGGRGKRSDERAILAALDAALPPEKIQQVLTDALAWAYEYKSPKVILSIVQFVVAYQIGQPIQRSVSASGKLETILNRLSTMDENEFEAVERAIRGE